MAHGMNTTGGTRKESRSKGSCISESASRELTVMSQRALLTTILQVRHRNPQARWPFCPLTTVTNRGGGTLKTFLFFVFCQEAINRGLNMHALTIHDNVL